jgi:hypothetical protein
VLGGHTFIARSVADGIARKLGNALVAPVLLFSPTDNLVKSPWPGTISVSTELYRRMPFNLALTPRQLQRCFDGLLISCQAICEADQGSLLCRSKPLWESCEITIPDDAEELPAHLRKCRDHG